MTMTTNRSASREKSLADARKEAAEGFAELDRGEGILGTVDEHMARIDAAVRGRITERATK
jgi:hypothetical protein